MDQGPPSPASRRDELRQKLQQQRQQWLAGLTPRDRQRFLRRRAEAQAITDALKAEAARRTEDLPAMVAALQGEFPDLFGALSPLKVRWEPAVLTRHRLNGFWDDWLREVQLNPLVSPSRLREVLLHELGHAAAIAASGVEGLGHGPAFQRVLGALAARGEMWAAIQLREYTTKGTPEAPLLAEIRTAIARVRRKSARTKSRERARNTRPSPKRACP